MRDYNIESDLKQEKFEVIKLVQGDKGNKLTINVLEDGKPVSLTGCSITAKYKRADGQVINGSVINISNNSFDAVIDSDITKVVGTLKMLFSIEKDDVKVSTFLLLADVREGLLENTGSSGGSTGGGEVTVDLSNYYKKNETYSKAQIDSQFKDIAKQIENVKSSSLINQNGGGELKIWAGTKVEYDALLVKDENTVYLVEGSGGSTGGDVTVTTYSITNNLTNCTNSNTNTSINENDSYRAKLTPNENYALSTVVVTMSGVDITKTAYTNGNILIENVTGNIVITANATEQSVSTNIAYQVGYSCDTSGNIVEDDKKAVTDYIPVTSGNMTTSSELYHVIRYFNSTKTYTGSSNGLTQTKTLTISNDISYIRFILAINGSASNVVNDSDINGKTITINNVTYTLTNG